MTAVTRVRRPIVVAAQHQARVRYVLNKNEHEYRLSSIQSPENEL
jgi:hypothetical protein